MMACRGVRRAAIMMGNWEGYGDAWDENVEVTGTDNVDCVKGRWSEQNPRSAGILIYQLARA